ncbi:Ste24 endopeptidase [Malassezia equina]|uniref:CAAX prenyl protease n=1 Tax=Malassezia equina TaxID=1381935 RepID=A0AAF0E9K6_9BASI|nr:Ste24 endopeptidase [Malassezia equina]
MTHVLSRATAAIHAAETYLDTDAIPWKRVVLALLWVVYLFETYVMMRQYRLYSLTTPPKAVVEHVSHEDFLKSQRYGRDKARFGFVANALSHAMMLLMVVYNGHAHMWVASTALLNRLGMTPREPMTTAVYMIVSSLVALPLSMATSAYSHFVVEERHGFNKLTWPTFLADTVKQEALNALLGAPLCALFVMVVRWAGDAFVAYAVLFFIVVILFGSVVYPTVIQPLFNRLTPLPEGQLRDRVTALATQLRFPLKHLYVIDGSRRSGHSNAYFYGIVPGGGKHIVLFDTLIEQSSTAEIEAVLAHELGHWSYSHPAKMMTVSVLQLTLTLSVFTLFFKNSSLFRAFGFSGSHAVARVSYLPVLVGFELFNMVLKPTDAIVQFGFHALIRRFEYQADRFAVTLSRPGPTPAESEARRWLTERGPTEQAPDATVQDWVEKLREKADEEESYPDLLKRALVKLQIHNHPTLPERWSAIDRVQAALRKSQ